MMNISDPYTESMLGGSALSNSQLFTAPVARTVEVGSPEKRSTSFSSYYAYPVKTVRKGSRANGLDSRTDIVERRFSDFEWLFTRLWGNHLGVLVPPLPDKRIIGNLDKKFVNKRKVNLSEFLRDVTNHRILSHNADLDIFLTATSDAFEAHKQSVSGPSAPTPPESRSSSRPAVRGPPAVSSAAAAAVASSGGRPPDSGAASFWSGVTKWVPSSVVDFTSQIVSTVSDRLQQQPQVLSASEREFREKARYARETGAHMTAMAGHLATLSQAFQTAESALFDLSGELQHLALLEHEQGDPRSAESADALKQVFLRASRQYNESQAGQSVQDLIEVLEYFQKVNAGAQHMLDGRARLVHVATSPDVPVSRRPSAEILDSVSDQCRQEIADYRVRQSESVSTAFHAACASLARFSGHSRDALAEGAIGHEERTSGGGGSGAEPGAAAAAGAIGSPSFEVRRAPGHSPLLSTPASAPGRGGGGGYSSSPGSSPLLPPGRLGGVMSGSPTIPSFPDPDFSVSMDAPILLAPHMDLGPAAGAAGRSSHTQPLQQSLAARGGAAARRQAPGAPHVVDGNLQHSGSAAGRAQQPGQQQQQRPSGRQPQPGSQGHEDPTRVPVRVEDFIGMSPDNSPTSSLLLEDDEPHSPVSAHAREGAQQQPKQQEKPKGSPGGSKKGAGGRRSRRR